MNKSIRWMSCAAALAAAGVGCVPFADRPVRADFKKVLDAARQAGTKELVLDDGVYTISEAVALGAADSGLTIRAKHPGKAVLTGARPLEWTKPAPADWAKPPLALVPAAARAQVRVARIPGTDPIPGFTQGGCTPPNLLKYMEHPPVLFQNGERLTLAKAPDEGRFSETHFQGKPRVSGVWYVYDTGVFEVLDGARARLGDWAKEPDLWAHGLWCFKWSDARCPVTNVCPAKGIVALDEFTYGRQFRDNQEYYVFNAFSEITRPGEWAIDRKTRTIALWPKPGADAELTGAESLLAIRDAEDIRFSGLVFETARKNAVNAENCRRLRFEKSVVRRTGGWGIRIEKSSDCRVEGCDLYDLGEGGVTVEGGDENTLTPGRNVVDNCHIHHYGKWVPNYRPGVSLNGVGNVATHNLIHHADHQGLNFRGQDHYFAFNIVHDTCMHNDDAGALYTCMYDTWQTVGTTIEFNLIHETGDHPRPVHVSSTYFDDWSSGIRLRNNILSRASDGVAMGGGMFTEVASNVIVRMVNEAIAFNSRGTNSFARHEGLKGRNSGKYRRMLAKRPMLESAPWRAKHPEVLKWYDIPDPYLAHDALWTVTKDNLAVCCGDWNLKYFKMVEKWNVWTNNVAIQEDPGFADYEKLDFSAKKGGPYEGLIAGCRFPEMGLYASEKRISPPVRYGAGVTYPGRLRHDLESAVVRMDVTAPPKLPDGLKDFARGVSKCVVPPWAKGKRLMAEFGRAPTDWKNYAFTFVPEVDGAAQLVMMGLYGEMTEYAGIVVEGAKMEGADSCVANHAKTVTRKLTLSKGRSVTVRFRARQRPDAEASGGVGVVSP